MRTILTTAFLPILATGALLAGCAAQDGTTASAAKPAPGATAALADATGAARGTATVTAADGGLKLVYDGAALPAGVHGIHVHTTGKCDAPDFTTAGGHWNPTMKKHGSENPAGPHGGDMPNFTAAADGSVHYEAMLGGATLAALMDADGAAVVVHAAADDYRTDPAGNSGARIACGVLTAS